MTTDSRRLFNDDKPQASHPGQLHHCMVGKRRGKKRTMQPSGLHFFPLTLPFVLLFFLLVSTLIVVVEIGLLEYAYEKMGINRRYIFTLLLLSLLGSYVNIPVAELPEEQVLSGEEIIFFGMRYVIPFVQEWPRTIVAVNVGGAVIPILLSLYLLVKNRLYGRGLAGVAIVAGIVYWLAQPIRRVGIAVPRVTPPEMAAATALLLPRKAPHGLADVAGSLGTLIG